MAQSVSKHKIGVVGLGLIGGSICLSLRDKFDIFGYDPDSSVSEYAKTHGFCRVCDVSDMVGCSAIFVCVPVDKTLGVLRDVIAEAGSSVIVSDVCSIKSPFANIGERYVGGHPMAGTEKGGIKEAREHLFQNAYWAITNSGKDGELLAEIIKQTGAIPVFMTAEEHDRAVGAFSHTPHAVAYALVCSALKSNPTPIAGSGFMDTTRIAQSDEGFWTEVFKNNRANVLDGIDGVKTELSVIQSLLENEDYTSLKTYLSAARVKREALNRISLGGEVVYVDLVDRVGEFERVTGAFSRAGISLGNISLVPCRDGAGGALRLELKNPEDRQKAERIIARGFSEEK